MEAFVKKLALLALALVIAAPSFAANQSLSGRNLTGPAPTLAPPTQETPFDPFREILAPTVVTFGNPGFEWHNSNPGAGFNYIWNIGDYWAQTFSTTLAAANVAAIRLNISENVLNSGAHVDLDVKLNGVLLKHISIPQGFVGNIPIRAQFSDIAGPDYRFEFVETNQVAPGQGSVAMGIDGPSVAGLGHR
jgi:hypothetical protein